MLTRSRAHACRCRRAGLAVRAEGDNGTAVATAERKERKLSPLQRGGTLQGAAAAGKDASDKFKAMAEGGAVKGPVNTIVDGRYRDYRWKGGRWNLSLFTDPRTGETDWDAVIDAEMARRKLLEETPIPSINEEPVVFDTSEVPWWAWVRRFHLPEAEKLNGRAAMIGYVAALFVDQLSGAGLLDQQNSFLGKIALFLTVLAVLAFRSQSDVAKYKNLWNATWEGQTRPSETEAE
eukprot:scaffold11.g4020.t1